MNVPGPTPDAFTHVRAILGFVVSLGLARLLVGLSRFVQHPALRRDPLHLLWTASTLLFMVDFWWSEFWLYSLRAWTFPIYLFLVAFVMQLFLLTTLLFPDEISEYASYGDYFMDRRKWFFGLFACVIVSDVIDTLIKGPTHANRYELHYWIQAPVYVALCAIAIATRNRKFHYAFVCVSLFYQLLNVTRALAELG